MNYLKNAIIIGFLVSALVAVSFGATKTLVVSTSKPITNAISGSFSIAPSEVLFDDNKVNITIERRKKDGAEVIVSDCLDYYSEEYPEYKNITCNLVVKTNLLIDNSCEYIVGILKEEDGKNMINLSINPDC
jgi:hypothetical protein|tara:strand:+ start:32 stop:427 length:396 start_codon:yes stop_codon:yes gene_type:complete